MTDAKRAVQELSMGSIERFFRDWIAGETRYSVCACASWQLYRAYSRWCVAAGEKPRNQNNLSAYIIKQSGWQIELKWIFEDAYYAGTPRRTRMVIPEESVVAANEGATRYRKAADKTEAQWATDCFFHFKDAIGGDD